MHSCTHTMDSTALQTLTKYFFGRKSLHDLLKVTKLLFLSVGFLVFLRTFFTTGSSAAPQIPLRRRILGSNPGLSRLRYRLSDALTTRLDLVINIYLVFRNSACKVSGNGEREAVIEIPLKGCGTAQVTTG